MPVEPDHSSWTDELNGSTVPAAMRTLVLVVMLVTFSACNQVASRDLDDMTDRAQVAFHVLGLQKTPSGAT